MGLIQSVQTLRAIVQAYFQARREPLFGMMLEIANRTLHDPKERGTGSYVDYLQTNSAARKVFTEVVAAEVTKVVNASDRVLACRVCLSISFLAAVTIAACSGSSAVPPTGATPSVGAPPPASRRTITGSVWLYSPTGRQPLADVDLETWLELPFGSQTAPSVKSDSAGRFSFETWSKALVRLYTHPNGLYQPCLTTVRVDQTEATIRLVAESHILQARNWRDFMVERVLSGTIFEALPTARLPISGA